MDQRHLGLLAEEFASLAAARNATTLSRRVREEAKRWNLAPWTVVGMVSREWDRQGIARVPGALELH